MNAQAIIIILGILGAFALGFVVCWRYHCQVVSFLETQLLEANSERKLFLDHLGRAGFGSPIFPQSQASEPVEKEEVETEESETPLTQKEQEEQELRWLSRNPNKLARRVSRMMWQKWKNAPKPGPSKIDQDAALADIEAIERREAAK